MTLNEKVQELQAINPPLDGGEINKRLQEWKKQSAKTEVDPEVEALLDGNIISPKEQQVKKLKDPANVIPVVESKKDVESNLDPISLDGFIQNPVVVNDEILKANKKQESKKIIKFSLDKDKMQVDPDSPYVKNRNSFAKTVDALFNTGEYAGENITNLNTDYNFKKEIRKKATDLYYNRQKFDYSGDPRSLKLPDSFFIDTLINERIENIEQIESEQRRAEVQKTAAASKARGDYKFVLDSGIEQHISEFNKEEQLISNLNKKARDLRKIINTTDNIQVRSQAENELITVTKEAKEAVEGLNYTYAFDLETGRRAGTIEEVKNSEDWTEEIEAMATDYKSLDLEMLEQEYYTHVIEFDNIQERLNRTINLDNKNTSPELRLALNSYGYEPDADNVWKDIPYSALMNFQGVEELQDAIYRDPKLNDRLLPNLNAELQDISKDRNELLKEREAYKLAYLLNIDSGSLQQNAGDVILRFGETVSEAAFGEDATRSMFGTSVRKEIDFITDLQGKVGIKLTKEQEENYERTLGMKVLEGVGGFVPDLVKFGLLNKALGAAGISARLAQMLSSTSSRTRLKGHFLSAILEEGKFKFITQGESQTGGGIGFSIGGTIFRKIIPFRFEGNMARFNPLLEKAILGGPGGASGSEVALMVEALYKEGMGSKSFEQSMIDDYGEQADAMGRIVVNNLVFGLVGASALRRKDLSAISAQRALKRKYESELSGLQRQLDLFPGTKLSKKQEKEIQQKQNSIAEITRNLKVADRSFNAQDISTQISQRNQAQAELNSGRLTEGEARAAEQVIAKVQGNIEAASRKVNRMFEAVREGTGNKNLKLIVQEGKEGFDATNNKAEFDGVNTIRIDITAYKPGVENHEFTHVFFKAAFKNNPAMAKAFKRSIQNTVDKALKDEVFKGEGGKEVSFQEAIDFAYGKNRPAEEYVTNIVEFLSVPKYKDLLLKQGLLPNLKRNVLNAAQRMNLDFTNKKDFVTGDQLLEFMFGMGETFKSENPKLIKRKLEQFKDLVIDGQVLVDIKTGKPVDAKDLMPSKDIAVSELAVEYKDRNKEGQKMSGEKQNDFVNQYISLGIEAVSKWAAERGVPVSAIKNNPDIQGKLIDQLESITKNYKPIDSDGKQQAFSTYVFNIAGKRIGPGIVAANRRSLNERSTDSDFVKELEAGLTESNVDRLAREGEAKEQIDLRKFISNVETRNKVEDAVKIDKGDLSLLLTGKNVNQKFIGPVGEALLGLSEAKITGNETLNYGPESRDASKMQGLFRNLQQTMKFIESMPKYNVGTNEAIINKQGEKIEVSSDARGYSIGINRTILNKYYKPYVDPTKKMTTPKGKSKGKTSQPKVYILDFKPTVENVKKLQKDIGITPSGEMNVPIKGPARTEFGSTLQGLTKLYVSNLANTIVRSKINAEVVGAKGEKQTKADIKSGFSNRLASKEIELKKETKRLKGLSTKIGPLGVSETLDSYVNAEALARFRFDMDYKNAVIQDAAVIIAKSYADRGLEILLGPRNFTPGNKLSSLMKNNFNVISNVSKLKGKELIEANRLILAKEMIDLATIRNSLREGVGKIPKGLNEKQIEEFNNKINAFTILQSGKTGVNAKRNAENLELHNQGFKDMMELKKELFLSGEAGQVFVREMMYNAKLNANSNRNEATAVNVERGTVVDGKRVKDKTTDEHQLPASAHAIYQLKLFKNAYKAQESGSKERQEIAEYGIDLYTKFVQEGGYRQYLLLKTSDFMSGDLSAKGVETWKKSDRTMPPVFQKAIDNFIDLAGKEGTTKEQLLEAYEKIPSSDIRYFNKYGRLNPNILTEYLPGGGERSKAEQYDVVVPVEYAYNENVIDMQGSLIRSQILTKSGQLTGEFAVTGKQAQSRIDVFVKKLAEGTDKAQGENLEIFGSKLLNVEKNSIDKEIKILRSYDNALANGRELNKPVKKIRVFDFDDTLARSKSKVLYELPDGKTGKLSATEFARRSEALEAEGAVFDFTEFNKVVDGKKGPLFDLAKTMAESPGSRDMFVLTARPQASAKAIQVFLEELGLKIPIENITGLENGSANAKGRWIAEKAAKGYNDFYFADDAIKNVKAVKEVLDQIDVKSQVQQAFASKEIMFNNIFNDIIEQSTGIETYKEFSDARAKTIGSKKGRFTFFTTPSAEDFTGLLYKTLGKGKVGDAQLQFYNDNLIDPYNRAELSVTEAKITAARSFKELKSTLTTLPKSLSKETGIGGFTFSQAARVAVWTKQGMKIPGLSKGDLKELNDFVNNNAELSVFTDQLVKIQKGKMYPAPGKEWLAGTITTDIIGEINKVNRKEYLQEWQQNVDIVFSDKNLNKLEAAYGSKYREALTESLYRMKTGSNRPVGGSRIVNEMMDWLNNSVGAIMFLNTRSAVLQTISSVNFIDWKNNNMLKAGKAFANQPQYWKDFKTLMNSPYLLERREGLKINVSESEIADAVMESKNKVTGAINYLLNKGFVFTRIADSFAIASGGATYYRNQLEAYVKSGMSKEAAEKKAYEDFYAIAETNQQSSNPSKISQQQASAAGRVILAFGNTPMQYNRIIKKATQDLVAGRGDYKSNLSKIVYYAGMQNFIFNALQNALFAEAFGEDEEEESKTMAGRQGRIADGMTDSLLRGVGIQGAAVSAVKDALVTIYKENNKEKGTPKYEKAIDDLIGFSPPISSKIRKIRGGLRTFSWNAKKIKEEGFNLNNPAYLAGANIISGFTNIPLDRAVKKINNMRNVFSDNSEAWQKVALTMGWSTWDVGLPYYGVEGASKPQTPAMVFEDKINEIKKNTTTKEQKQTLLDLGVTRSDLKKYKYEEDRVKKILELEKEFKDNPNKKDSLVKINQRKTIIFAKNKPDQVAALVKLGLSQDEIKKLKYEKDRVEKIIELQNKN